MDATYAEIAFWLVSLVVAGAWLFISINNYGIADHIDLPHRFN